MKKNYTLKTSKYYKLFLFFSIIIMICTLLPTCTQAQLITQTESFEGTISPAPGWNVFKGNVNPLIGGNGSFSRGAWVSAINPATIANPSGTTNILMYNAFSALAGDTTLLISKPYDFSNNGGTNPQMSFYMYRDNGFAANTDRIEVFINTVPSIVGATAINHGGGSNIINRSSSQSPIVGVTNQWYQYTFPLAAANLHREKILFYYKRDFCCRK